MKEDIGVYMSTKVHSHKLQPGKKYWTLPFRGKLSLEEMRDRDLAVPHRLWVAFNGYWQGYFEIDQIEGDDLIFEGLAWNDLEDWHRYPRSPFRGFTYKVPFANELSKSDSKQEGERGETN